MKLKSLVKLESMVKAEILWGYANMFIWTAYRNKHNSVTLQFGCECHLVDEWENIHVELAKKNGFPKHAGVTRAVCDFVKAMMC